MEKDLSDEASDISAMYEGPQGSHADSEIPNNAPNEGNYRAPILYEPFLEKEGYDSDERKYGAIEQRGWGAIQVTSPVDDVEELLRRTYITTQFHEKNRDYWEEQTSYENDAGLLYDKAILDLFDNKLKCEGIDLSESDIPERRLKALFLRKAREQNGTELHEHLTGSEKNSTRVRWKIGYYSQNEVPSYSTLQRAFRNLNQGKIQNIQPVDFDAAVTRAVYAVYRAGVVPPDTVKESYNFNALEPPLDEQFVPRDIKKAELRDCVERLVDKTIDPLTFGRESDKKKHEMEVFIAALAASALTGAGLENLKNVYDWNYPREQIPSGSWMYNYISNRLSDKVELSDFQANSERDPIPPIDEQFKSVHGQTLTLAKELGFWSGSDQTKVAVDMFRIDWTGESIEVTIGRPPKADNEAVTEEWTYVIASVIDTERRFVLGGSLIPSLDQYPEALGEILRSSTERVDIDTIYIDGEIVGGELIKTLRSFVGNDWAISAPNKSVIKGIKRLTPSNYAGFAPEVQWNIDPGPNVVTYPYDGDNPSTVKIYPSDVLKEAIKNEGDDKIDVPINTDATRVPVNNTVIPEISEKFTNIESQPGIGNENTHAAYLTDRTLPEHSASGIRFSYLQRWSIEKTIEQITNHFMPTVNSKNKNQRLFGLHIAILLYNWHTLINRCLSPGGIRLDITHQELLKAIIDIGFLPQQDL